MRIFHNPTLIRTLPSFWEVIDSFVLVAYARLATSRTLLEQLLACLNFTLYLEDLFCWCKQKK